MAMFLFFDYLLALQSVTLNATPQSRLGKYLKTARDINSCRKKGPARHARKILEVNAYFEEYYLERVSYVYIHFASPSPQRIFAAFVRKLWKALTLGQSTAA